MPARGDLPHPRTPRPPGSGAATGHVGLGTAPAAAAAPTDRAARAGARDVACAAVARDREVLWRARFRQSLRTRGLFVVATAPFLVADRLGAGFAGTWRALAALQLLTLAVNAAAAALDRAARVREWHFWAVLAFDFAVMGGLALAIAPFGYLALPFLAVAVGRYTLGQPAAGRVGLALAVALYAAARLAGLRLTARGAASGGPPAPVVAVEVATLAVVGCVALWGPAAYTRRVARVRRALAALGGDLTTRLSTDDMDDLRPLAEGFNRTAEALAAATAALERRASQDPLTGLANRAGLAAALREALGVASWGGRDGEAGAPVGASSGVGVLAVDLDGFKAVNDTHGHAAGDRVLQAVTARLLDATRGSDLVARLGGDEFVVLLRQVRGPAEARVVAARIVAAVAAPVPLGATGTASLEGSARVGASVGVALAGRRADEPGDGGDGSSGDAADARADARAAALLRDADRALYQAKALGRGRYVLFGAAEG